ncbi:MAG: M56 family metallopeptidase [Peptostreptococcaceae bacterium]|nr:M56 family metallopeptidase [Peptostreptococcaceae bacterium]
MNFLMILLTASLIMSLIMLALFGLSSLSRQTLNAQTRYFMWIILLIGLIIPFRPLLGDGLIKIQEPISWTKSVEPSKDALSKETATTDTTEHPITDQKGEQGGAVFAQPSVSGRDISIPTVLSVVWAAGAIVLFAKYMLEYRRFQQIIKRWGKPVTDPFTLETFEWVKARMGLEDKEIGLLTVSTVSTPMLTGLFKPVVLLPEKPIADDEMELILEHELTHYKHKDLLINLIGVIALCIHWFNPILYLCMPAIYGDGESYCDEAVLKNKDLDYRRFYGEVIISMIEASPPKPIALSTCFYAKKLNIKRRLFNIMESHGKRRKLSISSVTLMLCLTIVSGSVIVFADSSNKIVSANDPQETRRDTISKDQDPGTDRSPAIPSDPSGLIDIENNVDSASSDRPKDLPPGSDGAKSAQKTADPKRITPEQAKRIALDHAKQEAGQVRFFEVRTIKNGTVYQIEFYGKNTEYDYRIDARTGEILEQDRDIEGFEIEGPKAPDQKIETKASEQQKQTLAPKAPTQRNTDPDDDDDHDDDDEDDDEDEDDD